MRYDPDIHHRRSIRLQGYDYSQPGAYFVTICALGRECLFGEVIADGTRLSACGQVVRVCWNDLPHHYANVQLDEFVVMPNHVHGIIVLTAHTQQAPAVGAGLKPAPTQRHDTQRVPAVRAGLKPAPTQRHGLPEIVRAFKTFSARRVNELRATPGIPLWQRNYYEHVIRDDDELNRIRQYIIENPLKWALDPDNPLNAVPARMNGGGRRPTPVGAGLKPAPTQPVDPQHAPAVGAGSKPAPIDGAPPLPPGWRWARLGDIFNIQQGVAMSPARRDRKPARPFLRTLNINWGGVDLSELDEMYFTDEEVERLTIRDGDLLVCEGGDVGRTAIWRGELPVCLHQNHVHRLRSKDIDAVPEVFMYWMQLAMQSGHYAGRWGETTIPNLSAGRLAGFEVPLPPLPDQRRIAAILRDQLDAVRRARQAAFARLEAARALPAAFLRSVFESEDARRWRRARLATVCSIHPGQHILEQDYNRNANGSGYLTGPADFGADYPLITKWTTSPKAWCQPGDVLVTVKGAGVGKTNLAPAQPVAIGRQLMAIRTLDGSLDPFVLYQFLRLRFSSLASSALGSTVPGLDRQDIASVTIALPPAARQEDLAQRLRAQLTQAAVVRDQTAAELACIDALPQALLRRAFSGER